MILEVCRNISQLYEAFIEVCLDKLTLYAVFMEVCLDELTLYDVLLTQLIKRLQSERGTFTLCRCFTRENEGPTRGGPDELITSEINSFDKFV